MRLIQLYVNHVRPFAALNGEDKNTAKLFLRSDGQPDTLLERHVQAFYLTELDIHITTTRIRKIVDTTVRDMRLRGEIDDEGMDSVLFVNGHSEKTSNDYYVQ
jgi:hypothetical protein